MVLQSLIVILLLIASPVLYLAFGARLLDLLAWGRRRLKIGDASEPTPEWSRSHLVLLGLLSWLTISFFLFHAHLPLWVDILLLLAPAVGWPKLTLSNLKGISWPTNVNEILWYVIQLGIATSLFNNVSGIQTPWTNNYGDLTFHLGMIGSFVFDGNTIPEYHIFPGEALSYPFFMNFWSAIYWSVAPSFTVLLWVFIMQWMLVWSLIYKFLNGNKFWFLPWALLFGGGSYEHLAHNSGELIGQNVPWTSFITTVWVPQRTSIIGMAALLGALSVFHEALNTEGATLRKLLLRAGVLLGLMPLAHTHFFMVGVAYTVSVLGFRAISPFFEGIGTLFNRIERNKSSELFGIVATLLIFAFGAYRFLKQPLQDYPSIVVVIGIAIVTLSIYAVICVYSGKELLKGFRDSRCRKLALILIVPIIIGSLSIAIYKSFTIDQALISSLATRIFYLFTFLAQIMRQLSLFASALGALLITLGMISASGVQADRSNSVEGSNTERFVRHVVDSIRLVWGLLLASLFVLWIVGKGGLVDSMACWNTGNIVAGQSQFETCAKVWFSWSTSTVWLILIAAFWAISRQHILALAILTVFIPMQYIKLAEWSWDQIKIFIGLYGVFLAAWSASRVRAVWYLQFATPLLMGATIYELAHQLNEGPMHTIYTEEEVKIAEKIRTVMPPKSVIAGKPDHNSPMTLTGRALFMGYTGTLSSHKISYQTREDVNGNLAKLRQCETAGVVERESCVSSPCSICKDLFDPVTCADLGLAPRKVCPSYLFWSNREKGYYKVQGPGEGFEKTEIDSLYRIIPSTSN